MHTSPFGAVGYGMWPMGGAWCTQHFMEHYRFTRDREFLRDRAYPILKEASLFYLDWLIENFVAAEEMAYALKLKGTGNVSAAVAVGKAIAEKAKEAGVTKVAFDRSGFRYHGRVKALEEAAREHGLEF